MGVPTYLTLSRHNVYYLRWPLPQSLHPQGKASDIKVSLRTRDQREALRLSRHLAYVAETLTSRSADSKMRYDEIRAVIKRHFKGLLEKRREDINAHGRLSAYDHSVLASSLSIAEAPGGEGLPLASEVRDDALRRFQALYGLSLDGGSEEYRMLADEFQRGYRDFIKAVLRHDRSLDGYTFDSDAAAGHTGPAAAANDVPATPLSWMAERYLEEGELASQWAAKTLGEKREQFALLYEIVGADIDARAVTLAIARKVKEVIMKYPKNRNKDGRTRGLSLDDALAVEGVQTISVKTINTYLASYGALFRWGKRNGYVEENPFAEMAVRDKRKQGKGERQAFSPEHSRTILDELQHNSRGLIRKDYQKWGSLIGLYSGARLGEIAQLRLADIRQHEGIWCFDINDDDGKQLKTDGSKRRVPVHSKLIEYGLLEHIETMQKQGHEKLFPEFAYCPKNGWGRNLGQWFNNRFLVELGIKRKELVFHSLRHTMVTRLSQSNVPEPIVKAIVGHAQDGVTQQHYFKEGYTLKQLSDAIELFTAD
ncbi:MAG: site-specific integrase [Alphaproteobacteria bacterium]|nr:MAG: site-specific integrase [Alphaproteobacteria bacterium]